ncbi:CHAT domain-containing protein [Streptomyces sp. NPDC008317]|uniref:CHAT domain-containing protein n=1 Tax=Streptomyces sp. NPDC008317 TaxID=3364827 RepID=UPI0036E8D6EC
MRRCEASWSSDIERRVGAVRADPRSWLSAADGLLLSSWSSGGRDAAVAAAALLEFALDTGARDDPGRPAWVLHLWLAERTLSFRFGDYRLSRDVQHHLGAQKQGRTADDPVRVAATYPELPLPRHFQPVLPIESAAARLADSLPRDDIARCCLLVRLAQSACFRYESGDESALPEMWRLARAAHDAVTPDHLEAELVGRTAAHAAVVRFRADPKDRASAAFAVTAGRLALAGVEHARVHGTDYRPHEAAPVHLLLAIALMSVLTYELDLKTADEAIAHMEAFRADGPPDDGGVYAVNMASLLAARAVLSGSRRDVARSDELWAMLQRDLRPGDPLLPHIAQKRAATAEMVRLMGMLPFKSGGLLRLVRPWMGPLLTFPPLPPIRLYEPPRSPGYRSPGAGPEEMASFGGAPDPEARTPRGPDRERAPGGDGGPASSTSPHWPPCPAPAPGLVCDPALESDLTGLPPDAEAVLRSLVGVDTSPSDPRRLALAEKQLLARLAEPGLSAGRRGWTAAALLQVWAAKYLISRDAADLERAVRAGDDVLATLPATSSRYIELLCAVEEHRQAYGSLRGDAATMLRACDGLRWAVDHVRPESPQWVACAMFYAKALAGVSMLRRDPDMSKEAVGLVRKVARTLEALPDAPGHWGSMAEQRERLRPTLRTITDLVVMADHDLRGDLIGVEEAEVRWQPEAEAKLPPAVRFENARVALGRRVELGDWARAADAAAVALEMLPLLTSRALHRDDRQRAVHSALQGPSPDSSTGTSLTRTGCAVALAAGRTEQAAALLEQGRAVLMSQDLEARGDVSDLAEAHPRLAARFTDLAGRMREADDIASRDETSGVRAQHRAAEQWRLLLGDIRSHPGFGSFLLPPTAMQMQAEAVQGPIVLINIDRLRCDALVVTSRGIRTVTLDVTEGLLAHTARDFLAAVAVDLDSPKDVRAAAAETIFRTLEWLWDKVAEPVLRAAGLTEPIPEGTPRHAVPRLWWSASGPLAHLPLHAAGYQRKADLGERRSVLDRVASSYTPSIRALRHARLERRPAAQGAARHLAVGRATGTDGGSGAAAAEISAAAGALAGLRVIADADATVDGVLAALPSASTVHFACHGVSDPDNPSKSHLLLADGPLEVRAVNRHELPYAQLAVLLACNTSRTDRLPDEAIHLTSAFLTAGYPQVIGSLWEAADLVSAGLARRLYRSLRRYGGGIDVGDCAVALHGVVRELRARHAASPAAWAPYIHTGR